jgi:anti-sigma regulatory factor (Ser/Thr protein kinase)
MTAGSDPSIVLSLGSHPRFLTLVRVVAGEGAALAGFAPDERDRIEVAVVEGFTNVIRHGYGGRTDQRIDVRMSFPPGSLRIEIEDWGRFVDPSKMVSRPLDEVRPGGLGIHLMKVAMDRVEYRENPHGGTTLVLEKRRVAAPGGARS